MIKMMLIACAEFFLCSATASSTLLSNQIFRKRKVNNSPVFLKKKKPQLYLNDFKQFSRPKVYVLKPSACHQQQGLTGLLIY